MPFLSSVNEWSGSINCFGIQIGSILGSFFASVFGHISDALFLENCSISAPANPQFWCSRLSAVRFFEFSSNRKQIQNERNISPKWLPKSTKQPLKIKTKINVKSHQIFYRFLPPKWSQHEPKMGGKKVGKFGFGHLGRPRGPQEPQRRQRSPRAPKMKPKGASRPPK